MEHTIQITFLRHGRSRADDERVHEGRYDSPLTDVGRTQARARGEAWRAAGLHFERIVASPLLRAHETAAIIGEIYGLGVETDPDWMEWDNGQLAGLPFEEAAARYPKPSFRNPYEPVGETGESEWALYCRAARAVESLVRGAAGHTLVVAHGGILNAALKATLGALPAANRQGVVFRFGDTGYARLAYTPSEHRWTVLAFQAG